MKKSFLWVALTTLWLSAICSTGCKGADGTGNSDDNEAWLDSLADGTAMIPMKQLQANGCTYNVADINDEAHIYTQNVQKERCFFVISKREYRLYVYQAGRDTTLVAHFPICYARYAEAKTRSGDMRTPESTMQEPFHICQIQDASDWHHDFGDGRGSIRSYGDWFLRLETPGFKGVGIHGSTNNDVSVPGRDSEGCIRLRDPDICTLHDLFATVGTPVVIKGIDICKWPFELAAQQRLGNQYVQPRLGNPNLKNVAAAEGQGLKETLNAVFPKHTDGEPVEVSDDEPAVFKREP